MSIVHEVFNIYIYKIIFLNKINFFVKYDLIYELIVLHYL